MDASIIRLEEVTPENWRVDLHVREDQQQFVASREGTMARAFAYRERRSQAFIIMAGEEPVGMAMYYDSPQSKAYFFSEFFIDERYQSRGFGRAAAELVLERMRADGRYARVLLCYVDGNDVAKRLYESLGFHCTDEADGGEIVMELIFPEDAKELPLRPAVLSDAPRESGDGRVGITPVGNADSGEVHIGRKIIVVGSSGSGKSTFARRLHERTGLPLTHLDLLWWRPDATNVSREDFDRALDEVLRRDEWIIDGLYTRTLETRLLACDTVIFLDLPEVECLRGIEQRVGTKRPDIPWVEERVESELVELVHDFHARKRGMLLELLAQHPEKQVLTFTSRADADAWLDSLPAHTGSGGESSE
ncbi:MAG: GNAT family N-acetyltransferase [Eggerthellaceae bacterium]|nr:GNAT family N-acetyltransferase [Eggerthellaceae bacterium]